MPICRRDRSNRARRPSSASCSSSCRRRAFSAGVELVLPRHRQRRTLGVVVEAGKPDERRLALRRRRRDLPDEPAALADERDPARLEKGFHRRSSTRRPSPPRSSIIRSTSPTGPSWVRTGDGGGPWGSARTPGLHTKPAPRRPWHGQEALERRRCRRPRRSPAGRPCSARSTARRARSITGTGCRASPLPPLRGASARSTAPAVRL